MTIRIPNYASITYFVVGNKGQGTRNRPIWSVVERITLTQN
jgi:hypothetical protein